MPQPAFNQQVASTSATLTFGANPPAGSAILMMAYHGTGTLSSVSGCGATWSRIAGNGSNGSTDVWLGVNCSGAARIITLTGPTGEINAQAVSISGADTTSPLDSSAWSVHAIGGGQTIDGTPVYGLCSVVAFAHVDSVTANLSGTGSGGFTSSATTTSSTHQSAAQWKGTAPGGTLHTAQFDTPAGSPNWYVNAYAIKGATQAAINLTCTLTGAGGFGGTGSGDQPTNPLPLEVRVYDKSAPNGPPIATWEGQKGLSWHDPYNAVGAGQLALSLSDPKATLANLAKYNLVRCFLGPFDVFQFWVETPAWTVASPDGPAGEMVVVAGRSLEAYLERAMVWITGNSFTASAGAILTSLIDAARARGACSLLRYDFDAGADSAGVAWGSDYSAMSLGFTAGTDYLSVIETFRRQGLIVRLNADFTLQMFQSLGRNVQADGVVLRQARHLNAPVNWTQPSAKAASTMLARSGTSTAIVDDVSGVLPDRMEGYIEAAVATNDATVLTKLATAEIAKRYQLATGINLQQVDHGIGPGQFEPYRHYDVGDYVGFDVPGRFDNVNEQVAAITVQSGDEADYTLTLDLSAVVPSPAVTAYKLVARVAQPTG